jgi:dynein heavy chain
MGLIKHVDLCVDVGERASKEYNIEMMLKTMWKAWEDINFDLTPYKSITYIIRGYD